MHTPEVPDPIRRDDTVHPSIRIREEMEFHFEVRMDCEMWFGLESVTWSHEERCRRLVDFYNGLWHEKGGTGDHPYNYKYKEVVSA
jgi:hypothetical protein